MWRIDEAVIFVENVFEQVKVVEEGIFYVLRRVYALENVKDSYPFI